MIHSTFILHPNMGFTVQGYQYGYVFFSCFKTPNTHIRAIHTGVASHPRGQNSQAKSAEGCLLKLVGDSTKEGVCLRNVSAAPICNHFAVEPPMSRIRESEPFLI